MGAAIPVGVVVPFDRPRRHQPRPAPDPSRGGGPDLPDASGLGGFAEMLARVENGDNRRQLRLGVGLQSSNIRKERRIKRWEHEAILEAAQERLDRNPDMMTVRRSTVEHAFGTLKFWMGSAHFLMKRLRNVRTEMSLHVLSYNMKRVMNILGVPGLLQAMQA
jgi:Transposase DDE domain